ncbi:MAG: LysM peptidoglycan-binding domain-containing protein [Pseudomonadota bacterium]
MIIRPSLPLALGLGLATLLASACSVHDSERALDTADAPEPVLEPRTPADVQDAIERQTRDAEQETADTDDLWERARRGFAFSDALDHERVRAYIDHYREHPRIIEVSTERAEPFAYFILSEIERRGMPSEFLLLPIVESAYAADATSSGRAAGIWQFIPSTGDHFDLQRDLWYDGRRDVYQSTLAALDYLEALYARFDDWYLALAAYNFGQGNLMRAIQQNRERGQSTDYWSLDLSREAMRYVPRLLALRELFLHPDRYDTRLTPIANAPAVEMIEPERQADLTLIAELAGLEPETLKRLNPGYQRHATHPQGARHLFVPHDTAEPLRAALADRGDEPLVRFREYTVEHGDNLGRIARRNGTRVAILRQMNNLRSDLIRVGQVLRLPVTSDAPASPATPRARPAQLESYEVRPGDSLWAISRKTGMGIGALRAANGLEPGDVLRPGDTLKVNADAAEQDAQRELVYEVQPGDSLSTIARRFGVDIADLRRWNSLDGDGIRAGETLTLFLARADDALVQADS